MSKDDHLKFDWIDLLLFVPFTAITSICIFVILSVATAVLGLHPNKFWLGVGSLLVAMVFNFIVIQGEPADITDKDLAREAKHILKQD